MTLLVIYSICIFSPHLPTTLQMAAPPPFLCLLVPKLSSCKKEVCPSHHHLFIGDCLIIGIETPVCFFPHVWLLTASVWVPV